MRLVSALAGAILILTTVAGNAIALGEVDNSCEADNVCVDQCLPELNACFSARVCSPTATLCISVVISHCGATEIYASSWPRCVVNLSHDVKPGTPLLA
jgi:hypothetical protein